MSQQVKAVPEGMHTISGHLVVQGAAEAITFYERAFGGRLLGRMDCPTTGKVLHAEMMIGDSKVFICDEFPGMSCASPSTLGGSAVTLALSVEDADAIFAQAVEAGATPVMPVALMFWGDRYGRLTDPYGHNWSVSTHVEDVSHAEMHERMSTMFSHAS